MYIPPPPFRIPPPSTSRVTPPPGWPPAGWPRDVPLDWFLPPSAIPSAFRPLTSMFEEVVMALGATQRDWLPDPRSESRSSADPTLVGIVAAVVNALEARGRQVPAAEAADERKLAWMFELTSHVNAAITEWLTPPRIPPALDREFLELLVGVQPLVLVTGAPVATLSQLEVDSPPLLPGWLQACKRDVLAGALWSALVRDCMDARVSVRSWCEATVERLLAGAPLITPAELAAGG